VKSEVANSDLVANQNTAPGSSFSAFPDGRNEVRKL
jgi:hypothetical protein